MYQLFTDGCGLFEKDPETGYNKKQIGCERTYALFKDEELIFKERQEVKIKSASIQPSNITGECSAVLHGLAEALKYMIGTETKGELQIMHDYIGLRHWFEGTWKTKAEGPRQYKEAVIKLINYAKNLGINVTFIKVESKQNKAHTLFYGGK